jgi:hypothetical protein
MICARHELGNHVIPSTPHVFRHERHVQPTATITQRPQGPPHRVTMTHAEYKNPILWNQPRVGKEINPES